MTHQPVRARTDRPKGALVTAFTLGLTILSHGCSDSSDVVVIDDVDDAGPADASTFNACNECLYGQCSAQWAVCQNNPDCYDIYVCATAPGCDVACVFECYDTRPLGQAAYYALAACDCTGLLGACRASCEGVPVESCLAMQDGGVDATPAYDAGAVLDCTTCADTSCAAQKAACAPGTACDAYTQCLGGCVDEACVAQCETTFAAGKTDSENLSQCVISACGAVCGF